MQIRGLPELANSESGTPPIAAKASRGKVFGAYEFRDDHCRSGHWWLAGG